MKPPEDLKVLGVDISAITWGGLTLYLFVIIPVVLAVGGAVIWGVTNIWSALIHTVEMPNFNYWESVLLFAGGWLIARLMSDK